MAALKFRENIISKLARYALLSFALAATLPASADSAIDREIDKLVALHTDGFGYSKPKMRKVVFGPLFKPGSRDAVAFFTLAEVDLMNGYEEYIAIFAQGQGRSTPVAKERPYRLIASALVGTRWSRTLSWDTAKVSENKIVVQGTRWGAKDAGCCPTEPVEVTFSITAADGGDTRYPLLQQDEKPGRAGAVQPAHPAVSPVVK
jgi:hypothetical protein